MIADWFQRTKQRTPRLKAIYVADAAGAVMKSMVTVEAVKQRGLKGDRYYSGSGHWKSIEACQATLISEDDLRQAKKGASDTLKTTLDEGAHRRNLVIDGIKTRSLEGKEFRIGSATFKHEKARPPCGYIDQVSGGGMCKALGRNSGVCLKITTDGVLSVGDEVEVIE